MSDVEKPAGRSKFRRARWFMLGLVLLLALGSIGVPFASQSTLVPQIVDWVRDLPFVGPDRMAALENFYYDAQDAWTQFMYEHTHGPVVVAQIGDEDIQATPVPRPTRTPSSLGPVASARVHTDDAGSGIRLTLITPGASAPTPAVAKTPTPPPLPKSIAPLILSDPQAGEGKWTCTDLPLCNQAHPPIWRTFYRPDPERPYARVELASIDLSQVQLTLVPGTVEPRPVDGIRGAGMIPKEVQSGGKLFAAWNGGFMAMHGAYGMMVDRRVILSPRDGFAVLAIYKDGSLKIGVWGEDIKMTSDLVSYRQNGPILIDHGVLNDQDLLAWGRSVSGETRIWRSGIGLTPEGTLIYAAGPSLSAQTLGEALRRAGATQAMQLDVNAWHVFFYTYTLTPDGLVPQKLSTNIPGPLKLYLTPYERDLMYLTLK